MRLGISVLAMAASLAVTTAYAAPPVTPIEYSLKPVFDGDALSALDVTITFKASSEGKTELDLPDHWGGGKKLYSYLSDVTVDGADSVTTPAPQTRIIISKPSARLTVHYQLKATLKAGEEAPIQTNMTYPLIGPSRFYILGPTIFASIDGREDSPVRFKWQDVKGWTFASDLEHLPQNATLEDIRQSVLFGGKDVHVTQIHTPHTDLRIASAGKFDFDQAGFDDRVTRVIAAEQAFWNDGQDHFLVTLAPVTRLFGAQSVRGTGLGDAFAMITTPDIPEEKLTTTLAHEYFHSWNIQKLGGPEVGEASGYWFSEGFTDYYARKLALRAGIIDLKDFVGVWNEALNNNAISPAKTVPNSTIAADFWNNPDVSQRAYDRGATFAAYLNAKWRDKGVTIDQFMLALRDAVKAHPEMAKQPIMTRLQTVADNLGVPLADDLALYITKGEPLDLPEKAFGGCLRVVTEQAPSYERGYDAEKSADAGFFVGVDPESNAYKAGLRDGMKRLARLGGNPSDSSVPVSFRVRDPEGTERVITWLPQGKTSYSRQRLVIPEGLDTTALEACQSAVAAY